MNRSVAAAVTAPRGSQREVEHSPAPASGHSRRCLVLAESTSLRYLIRQILSLEGWDATEQEEPARPSYQAVVADLDCFAWPDERVNGAVRRAVTNGLPVLALTGQDLNPQEYAAIGRPRLLMKPFELVAFLQVLQAWGTRFSGGAEC